MDHNSFTVTNISFILCYPKNWLLVNNLFGHVKKQTLNSFVRTEVIQLLSRPNFPDGPC